MEIDEFEDHYTALSCLDTVIVGHYSLSNTCPYEVHVAPWFLKELIKETYDRCRFVSADDPRVLGRPIRRLCTAAGVVEIYCDYTMPKERVFEFRCKCSLYECLLKELELGYYNED